ncbi:MAG: SMP-30/gluconolactonase/LRE family protein [Pseudomonadota bacterium]
MQIDVFIDVKPRLGEGPTWDPDIDRFFFIDSLGDRIWRCDENGAEVRSWEVPGHIGSMALRKNGGAILALDSGFHEFDFETGEVNLLVDPEREHTGTRLNDGKIDGVGRFICGSMDMQEEAPTGSLWRLDSDFSIARLDSGIICSNGPCWSPAGDTLYFADSFRGMIFAYDYDLSTGDVSAKRPWVKVDGSRGGAPDGATVDEEGYVWSATVFDGRIFRYAPDGTVDRIVELPVCKTTSVAFGGPDLDILFVTSMAVPPLPKYPGDGPLRGSVFAVRGLGVRGLPEPKFAG